MNLLETSLPKEAWITSWRDQEKSQRADTPHSLLWYHLHHFLLSTGQYRVTSTPVLNPWPLLPHANGGTIFWMQHTNKQCFWKPDSSLSSSDPFCSNTCQRVLQWKGVIIHVCLCLNHRVHSHCVCKWCFCWSSSALTLLVFQSFKNAQMLLPTQLVPEQIPRQILFKGQPNHHLALM